MWAQADQGRGGTQEMKRIRYALTIIDYFLGQWLSIMVTKPGTVNTRSLPDRGSHGRPSFCTRCWPAC